MADGQRELLDRLRINRDDEDDEDGGNRWLMIGGGAFGVVLVVAAVYALWPSRAANDTVAAAEPVSTEATSTAATGGPGKATPPAPAGPPSASGVLSASGYVTARRLATVSAEITRRMQEVLVEEGMAVQAGQVLARMDTTLAQTELGIAEGNLKTARGTLAVANADNDEAQRALLAAFRAG